MTKFESEVKVIPFSQERVYDKLSNLNNLEAVKERLPAEKVKDIHFDADTLSFNVSPIGTVTLKIIEREPATCIKLESVQSPLPFNLWIQLVPVDAVTCKLKLTIGMELNPFMKGMVQKPLQEGVAKLADMLALIEY